MIVGTLCEKLLIPLEEKGKKLDSMGKKKISPKNCDYFGIGKFQFTLFINEHLSIYPSNC